RVLGRRESGAARSRPTLTCRVTACVPGRCTLASPAVQRLRAAVLFLSVIAATLAGVRGARACSCPERSVREAFDASAAVFQGTVVAATPRMDRFVLETQEGAHTYAAPVWLVRFAVTRTWKGDPRTEAIVAIASHGDACGRDTV